MSAIDLLKQEKDLNQLRENHHKENFEFELSDEQQGGLDFVNNSEKTKVLIGSAGTGKTTIIQRITDNDVLLIAPTHDAVGVMCGKTGKKGRTLASFLCSRPTYEGGKKHFKADLRKFAHNHSMYGTPKKIICDESSMISAQENIDLLACQKIAGFQLIFVGDDKQLPPVHEEFSPVFRSGYPEYKLNTIHRQKDGNDIIDLSYNLDWLEERRDGKNFKWCDREIMNDLIVPELVKANGSKAFKWVTWTNATVVKVNNLIRKKIYGNPNELEEGEIIVLTEPYKDYKNREEVKVDKLTDSNIYYKTVVVPHPYIETWLVNNDLHIIKESQKGKHQENIEAIKRLCKKGLAWKNLFDYKEQVAYFHYNHCLTTHRSQGQTFERCLIDVSNINGNPNEVVREKMLYTALTRASNFNYLA